MLLINILIIFRVCPAQGDILSGALRAKLNFGI